MDDSPTDNRSPENHSGQSLLAELSTPIYGLFILGILYTLYLAHQIILPIVLAVLTSLLLSPLVKKAYLNWRLPKVVSSLVLVLVVLAGIVGIGAAVATPALEWAQKAPEGISRLLVGDSEIMRQLDKVSQSAEQVDRKSTRLNSSHVRISYAVFCLKKK